jgi:hypothetical protein
VFRANIVNSRYFGGREGIPYGRSAGAWILVFLLQNLHKVLMAQPRRWIKAAEWYLGDEWLAQPWFRIGRVVALRDSIDGK